MTSVRYGKGMVLSVLLSVGISACASQKQVAVTSAHVAETGPRQDQAVLVRNFQRWLSRDVGWTQKQRLRHIQKDWLSALVQLPEADRRAAIAAIEYNIRSRRLAGERDRVVRQLMANSNVELADARSP